MKNLIGHYADSNVIIASSLLIMTCICFWIYSPISLVICLTAQLVYIFYFFRSGKFIKAGNSYKIFIFSSYSLIITSPFGLLKTPVTFYHLSVGLTSIALAYALSAITGSLSKVLQITSAALQAITLAYIFRNGISPTVLDTFLSGSSNGITSLLVLVQAAYVWAAFVDKSRAPLISSLILLFISIVGYGRGSIISSVAIFIICISMFIFNEDKKYRKFLKFSLVILFSFIFLTLYYDAFVDYLFMKTKISAGLIDQHRSIINNYYIDSLNFWTFLVGYDTANTLVDTLYNGNLHSSLLRAHSLFGIFYLISIFFTIFFSISLRMGNFYKFYMLCLCVIMLFRAFSEPILFPTALDVFFFIVLFYGAVPNSSLNSNRLNMANVA